MLTYLVRRLLYAIPILLGVNLLTFVLFFFVSSPESMARRINGEKASPAVLKSWMRQHGYDLPRLYNPAEQGMSTLTQTIFFQKSVRLLRFEFGRSDRENVDIGGEIRRRMMPSLSFTVPTFLLGLFIEITLSMLVAFYRGTYIDVAALILCVLLMSIAGMFYIIGGQYLVGTWLKLTPISGYEAGLAGIKFVVTPVLIGILSGLGGEVRFNRTIFLEEINKDYVRTARAKGLSETRVLFLHVLKNAMIPILTHVVFAIPFLFTGALMTESFFGIPGLGGFTIDAIRGEDFAIVRSMVYLGSVLYIIGQILTDLSYTLVDPRVRLG